MLCLCEGMSGRSAYVRYALYGYASQKLQCTAWTWIVLLILLNNQLIADPPNNHSLSRGIGFFVFPSRTYIILQRLWWKNKYKIFGKIFGAYVVKHYFCTRIRERTAHQHDERGNLWKGDEVRDSKQDSNRRSDSKKTLNFSSEKFAG